jgi:isopentenyl phosphate kinase
VKLGGSVITDKARPLAFRHRVARRLAGELAPSAGGGLVLVHGAGGFGHVRAAEYDLAHGMTDHRQVLGTAIVQRDVRDLDLRMLDVLIDAGVPAVSLPPATWLELEDGRMTRFDARPFQRAVARGLVPVTFGDVLMDTERGVAIASGDLLMAGLAGVFRPELAVFVTGVDGVYDGEPGDPGSRLLRTVSPEGATVAGTSAGEGVTDVTGSMGGKLTEAFQVAASSRETWIIGGNRPGRLRALLEGRRVKGTRVLPSAGDDGR